MKQSVMYSALRSLHYGIVVMGCFVFALLLTVTACMRNQRLDALLTTAGYLLNTYPDSVIQLLEPLVEDKEIMSKPEKMRWMLLLTSAYNQCDTVFRSDSLQQELVNYFDRHGTPNERMVAHYLLGRAYNDMGEAPRALQCFLDAVACADTTSRDCNFKTYFRTYGQIAMIYRAQYMPDEELTAWNQYSRYALKSGDMYNYIHGKEMTIGPYYDMGDTVSCLRITEQCHKEYAKHGMYQEAASVFPTAIDIHLMNSNYDKAGEMIKTFEEKSGLIDSCGNISKGRESYYYSKGLYYLGIHKNDSAEMYFRKLQGYHFSHDLQANKGLLALYQNKNNNDSISKYAKLYEKSVYNVFIENQAEAIAQAAAFNKYNRIQKESEELAVKAEKSKWISRLLLMLFILIAVVSACLFYLYKRRQKEKMEKLGIAYTNLMLQYRQACHEAENLQSDKGEALREKEDEIVRLKSKLDGMERLFEGLSPDVKKLAMSKSDIVKKFKLMSIPHIPQMLPSQKDWQLLIETMEHTNPSLYGRIILSRNLSQQEIYACLLTILHFSSGELTVLFDTSKQRVSNIKASANYKLFGKRDAKALLSNIENL